MTLDQATGALRAILPVVCTLLVAWGVLPADIASQLPEAVIQTVLATASFVTLIMTVWSWYTNRRDNMAKAVAATPGVAVIVSNAAPVEMKTLAADPAVPMVVPALQIETH